MKKHCGGKWLTKHLSHEWLKITPIKVALLLVGMLTAYYQIPKNLGFGATTLEEFKKTGLCEMEFYESDIDWSERTCYPGTDVLHELSASDIQEIIDCLPALKGRRMAWFEWHPENGVNIKYPDPVRLNIHYGSRVDASWVFQCYFVQKNHQYTVLIHNYPDQNFFNTSWYELVGADDFIETVLSHYPDRDVWIPKVECPIM